MAGSIARQKHLPARVLGLQVWLPESSLRLLDMDQVFIHVVFL